MLKVLEEVGETILTRQTAALFNFKNKNQEIIDGLGDSFVTLIILCYSQLEIEPKECLLLKNHKMGRNKKQEGKKQLMVLL